MIKQTGMKHIECKSNVDYDYIFFSFFFNLRIKFIGRLIVFNSPFVFPYFHLFYMYFVNCKMSNFPLYKTIYLFITIQKSC